MKAEYVVLGSRNRTLLEGYGVFDSYKISLPGTRAKIEKGMDIGEGTAVKLCYNIEDRKRIKAILEKEIRQGLHSKAFFDKINKTYKGALNEIRTKLKLGIKNKPFKEIAKLFDIYYNIYLTAYHPMVLAIYASDLQDIFEEELSKIIDKKDIMKYSALLLTPTKLTTVQKEEQIFYEIRALFNKHEGKKLKNEFMKFLKTADVQKKLNELEDRYGSFHMEYIGEAWSKENYIEHIWKTIEELRGSEEVSSPKERLEEIIKEQKVFFEKYNCSDFFKKLVFSMQEFLIVLDYTKADVVEGLYLSRPLLEEISRLLCVDSWIDVRFLTPHEIKTCLISGSKLDYNLIKERKNNFVILFENEKMNVYQGQKAKELIDKLVIKEDLSKVDNLKGLVTYPGKVEGYVQIVTSAKDLAKFKLGSILVTKDTSTELTSIIKKSKAIVADYGGLLSHTGIVSREFKIPCIVQTKIATSILKDGDLVEVDANTGFVKVIERAKRS